MSIAVKAVRQPIIPILKKSAMHVPIYLDYNATTPVDPQVSESMRPFYANQFGNPSSTHAYGIEAKKAIETARQQVAGMLNCLPDEIVFTSGGTESNNYAIKGIAFQQKGKGNHIITTTIEHPAVTEVCQFLETQGFRVSYIPVDEMGMVSPADIERAICPETILISVMHANNETGTIQPISEIGSIAKKYGIKFHTDAAQSAGKIPTDVNELGVDLLSIAGHKLYAPKGVGALYIRRGTILQKLIHGASHEHNLRAGTENVAQLAGFGKAADMAVKNLDSYARHMQQCRDALYDALTASLTDVKLNGHPQKRLPNTLNVSFPNVSANILLDELHEIAASAGAACHADQINVSSVLEAMHVPYHYAMGTVRFSCGRYTTMAEIEKAAKLIIQAVNRLNPEKEHEPQVEMSGTNQQIRLTSFTQGLGCACKISPEYLEQLLRDMPAITDKRVLTGPETSDDAAVYQISEDTAIVQTVDFFTPVVDDPYEFGAIAAANALSDIYAMGAKPLFALNIVGFPSKRLPIQVLKNILKGASDKAAEAGIFILGGHTIEDTEPKFGMVVTGSVHPQKAVTNSGAKPGDVLVLTKPIGTGIISTAIKRGLAGKNTERTAVTVMAGLNAKASALMTEFQVNACTDITGFGLLGHLRELVAASGVNAIIGAGAVPLIDETHALAMSGAIPGGTRNNLVHVSPYVHWHETLTETQKLILCDAQTSGGLLISMPEDTAALFVERLLREHHIRAAVIGNIHEKGSGNIMINQAY